MGFFDSVKKAIADAQVDPEERRAGISRVTISTGDLKEEYEILDTIFAMDSHQAGFFSSADPAKAFEGVKGQLRERGYDLGAHAVISCQFEYRVAVATSGLSPKQCIELFAYGTAVRLKKKLVTARPVAK